MNLEDLKRWASEDEFRWKNLRDRSPRYLSLEQSTAYHYGRMMAFRELIRFLSITDGPRESVSP